MSCRFRLVVGLGVLLLAACQDDTVTAPQIPTLDAQGSFSEGANAVTVLTRNVYLGAEIEAIARAPANQVPVVAAQVWAKIQSTDFTTRAQVLADEIEATNPQLIGLQEVSTYRTQTPSDFVLGVFT